ncbi:hypothetical protein ACFV6G_18615, partial [Streptomyces lavendulae]
MIRTAAAALAAAALALAALLAPARPAAAADNGQWSVGPGAPPPRPRPDFFRAAAPGGAGRVYTTDAGGA